MEGAPQEPRSLSKGITRGSYTADDRYNIPNPVQDPGAESPTGNRFHAKIQGDHLVLLNAQGKLAALFSLDIVESWNEVEVGCSGNTMCAG